MSTYLLFFPKAEFKPYDCPPGNDPRTRDTPCPGDGILQHAYNHFGICLFAPHGCAIGFYVFTTESLRYYQRFRSSCIDCIDIPSIFTPNRKCWIGPREDFQIEGDILLFLPGIKTNN